MGLRLPTGTCPMQGLDHDIGRIVEIGEQLPDLEQGLVVVLGRIEDVQDDRLEDFRGGLVPDRLVVPGSSRIGENGHKPLNLGQFARPGQDLRQGIPARRGRIARIEIQGVRKPRPPTRRDRPELTLGIMNQDALPPRQQGGRHMAPALAAARAAGDQGRAQVGRGEDPPAEYAEHGPGLRQQAGRPELRPAAPAADPARRPVAGHRPERQTADPAQQDQGRAARHRRPRLVAELAPPFENRPGRIEGEVGRDPPGGAKRIRPAVGPGERLGGRRGARRQPQAQADQLGAHVRAPQTPGRDRPPPP
jgi:hypothetical protein